MKVLVTGGAGYIGTHTCVELLDAGLDVVVVDNLQNSQRDALTRVEEITGKPITFYQVDITDPVALEKVFDGHQFDVVVHLAGLKAVGESSRIPLSYYATNVAGTVTLCQLMERHGVDKLLFSSSATVYGDPVSVPITESFPVGATNPYGRSKLIVEDILRDLCRIPTEVAESIQWKISLLRYFNPIGAHESGRIGEDPRGTPNNLLPYVAQVAVGRLPFVGIFGNDYDTRDGTGIRDYIHVVDLAKGHLKALQKLMTVEPGSYTYNLGTGTGYSVLEVIRAFEKASGKQIPYRFLDRRPGDIAECYADPALAARDLGWKAGFGLDRMMEDAWRWQAGNPEGYAR